MSTPNPIVKTRLKPPLHARFLAELEARGMSESELLRLALSQLFEGVSAAPTHSETESGEQRRVTEPNAKQTKLERKTVWMPAFLMRAACERAELKGMSFSRWACSLIQSNLMRDPVLTTADLLVIEAVTRELAAIGRYLAQIQRAMDEAHFETDRIRLDKLAALETNLYEVRDGIRTLIRSSRRSWEAD